MCDAATPIDVLKSLKWSVSSLANAKKDPGSYEAELARLAAKGIEVDIDWVIRTLEAAKEGNKNMGV